MPAEFRTIGFPDHLMRVQAGSFDLFNIQIASGAQVANFVRAAAMIAARWTGQFDMAAMTREQWQEWRSFRARLSGQIVLFEVRAPGQRLPLAGGAGYADTNDIYPITGTTITGMSILTGATSAVVAQNAQRYARSVLIDFGPSMAGRRVMTHGDMFGVGGNLYMSTGDSYADENGLARVAFAWRLHKPAFEGDIVQLRKPTCRVMLRESNEGVVTIDRALHGSVSLSFIEVPYTQ